MMPWMVRSKCHARNPMTDPDRPLSLVAPRQDISLWKNYNRAYTNP